ncbi:NADH-cytochrome b5 reductase-like isoform X2 [Acanthaster planci]|uniref:NADH-cytochrome b5 reductase-like isoform X2 n=1 Tax=Acanthaster planci TaxID=133434 RepID=A0A8B7Z3F9_ACAPL|nr:NADH-cytochrome b5 reductase-like isoform X2 [Acanthaster planci]
MIRADLPRNTFLRFSSVISSCLLLLILCWCPAMSAEEDFVDCETCLAQKPTEPLASDCCGTGCNPCVFDLHETELAAWRKSCNRCHVGGAQTEHREPAENKHQTSSYQDAFSPDEYRSFKLQSAKRVSHDSVIYTFVLPGNSQVNLGVGQHIILRGAVNGRSITRQYTPISPPGTRNHFEVLIKIYKDGSMSQYIKQWKEGDSIEWRGPYGTFSYQPNQCRRVVMLAAGTGITPMLQVIRHIVTDDNDETFVHLVYASRRMCRENIPRHMEKISTMAASSKTYWRLRWRLVQKQKPSSSCAVQSPLIKT